MSIYVSKYNVLLCAAGILISYSSHSADTNTNNFPQDEYEYYMRLIKSLNFSAYNGLLECHKDIELPCIEKSTTNQATVIPDSQYPIIVLPSILHRSDQEQISLLQDLINKYNKIKNTLPITKTERKIILTLINHIAPELYTAIKQTDPTGEYHIGRNYYNNGFACAVSSRDGLPTILVDQESILLFNKEELLASIAHELGHYVTGEFFHHPESSHNFQPTQKFTLAQQRAWEHAADRSEILDFDIPIQDAIKNAQSLQEFGQPEPLGPNQKTFTLTHPLWVDRIKHFESLYPEVVLKKAHGKGRTVFDWQTLADEYLKALKKK